MNKYEIKALRHELSSMKREIFFAFEDFENALRSIETGNPGELESRELTVGQHVRVFAYTAGKDGDESLCCEDAIVTQTEPAKNVYHRGISVRITEGALKGQEFKVYPQQCVPMEQVQT